MGSHRETMMSGGMPPAGDQRAAMHQQGAQMMQQTLQARQDLYNTLTPAQKAKADSLISGGYGQRRGMQALAVTKAGAAQVRHCPDAQMSEQPAQ